MDGKYPDIVNPARINIILAKVVHDKQVSLKIIFPVDTLNMEIDIN